MLEARALRKTFAQTVALDGVSLEIGAGEIVAITWPSGSGKSTLPHCLAGIIRPESGEVLSPSSARHSPPRSRCAWSPVPALACERLLPQCGTMPTEVTTYHAPYPAHDGAGYPKAEGGVLPL